MPLSPKSRFHSRGRRKRIPKRIRSQKICPQCGQARHSSSPPAETGRSKLKRGTTTGTADVSNPNSPPAESSVSSAWAREAAPLEPGTLVRRLTAAIPTALAEANKDLQEAGAGAVVAAAVRSAVLTEFRTRAQLIGRICEIDARLWAETGLSPAGRQAVDEHLLQLGLRRVTDPSDAPELFVVTEGHGPVLELIRPAYRDEITGQTILGGQLRRQEEPMPRHTREPSGTTDQNAQGEAQ
ncbi:hypothetical protein [Kitasatospora indigofera]|uniref:hypothetical protein n=1 Tax=Kitasatospora indigofera TaxID=67307 RepID=UPI0036A084D6